MPGQIPSLFKFQVSRQFEDKSSNYLLYYDYFLAFSAKQEILINFHEKGKFLSFISVFKFSKLHLYSSDYFSLEFFIFYFHEKPLCDRFECFRHVLTSFRRLSMISIDEYLKKSSSYRLMAFKDHNSDSWSKVIIFKWNIYFLFQKKFEFF